MFSGLEASDVLDSILTTATILIGIFTFYITYTTQKSKEREAREQEREKARREQRVEVYSEYLQAVAISDSSAKRIQGETWMKILDDIAAGKIGPDDDPGRMGVAEHLGQIEAERAFKSANANIVTYGSQSVITQLSNFYDCVGDNGFDLTHPLTNRALLELIAAMRKDSFAKDYDAFIDHADNILGAAANSRAQKLLQMQQAGSEQAAPPE